MNAEIVGIVKRAPFPVTAFDIAKMVEAWNRGRWESGSIRTAVSRLAKGARIRKFDEQGESARAQVREVRRMTRVVWPDWEARQSWDQQIIHNLTAGDEYEHGKWFNAALNVGGVVVIPGQHHLDDAEILAEWVAALPWALTIIASDEEAAFPIELLPNDARHETWTQYHQREGAARVIPIGLPPQTRADLNAMPIEAVVGGPTRDLDVFFAGQNTHARREELIDVMKDMACEPGNGNISWVASTGFRGGLDRRDYLAAMSRTKIAPCPSGYHSLDSFRLYEAIAAGALPIVEMKTPDGDEREFWEALYREMPGNYPGLLHVESWSELPECVERFRDQGAWRSARDRVALWYADYRASLAADFAATIARLQS